jgi:hypothetical protein
MDAIAQARIEQEERVDSPDERRGKRRQQGEQQVDPLDLGGVGHGGCTLPIDRRTRTPGRQRT